MAHGSVPQVRGRGLLLGVSFTAASIAKLSAVAAEGISSAVAGGAPAEHSPPAALLLHIYLLRAHGVRARPSGADAATLMLELPAVATDESIDRVSAAMREAAGLMRREAFGVLLACWLGCWTAAAPGAEIIEDDDDPYARLTAEALDAALEEEADGETARILPWPFTAPSTALPWSSMGLSWPLRGLCMAMASSRRRF